MELVELVYIVLGTLVILTSVAWGLWEHFHEPYGRKNKKARSIRTAEFKPGAAPPSPRRS
jgi:hypothetical protein